MASKLPNPLHHAGNQQRPPRDVPVRGRNVPGEGRAAPKPQRERKETSPATTITIDPDLLALVARVGRWALRSNRIRNVLWHCLRATPELASIGDRDLWDKMGRLGSAVRAIKESPEISERHLALGHLQRLILAIHIIHADPQRQNILKQWAYRDIIRAVTAWESALAKYLRTHPQYMLSHDEFAGFTPMVDLTPEEHQGLMNTPRLPGNSDGVV